MENVVCYIKKNLPSLLKKCIDVSSVVSESVQKILIKIVISDKMYNNFIDILLTKVKNITEKNMENIVKKMYTILHIMLCYCKYSTCKILCFHSKPSSVQY